jgi:hypothetical protein
MIGLLVNNKLEIMWKKEFKYCTGICIEEVRKTTKILSLYPGRNSKGVPPECYSESLSLEGTFSVG